MSRPSNHPNPMARSHGLAGGGRTCADCRHLERRERPYSGRTDAVCLVRAVAADGRNRPPHRATWDACSLLNPRADA